MHSLRQPAGKARDTPISFLNKKKIPKMAT